MLPKFSTALGKTLSAIVVVGGTGASVSTAVAGPCFACTGQYSCNQVGGNAFTGCGIDVHGCNYRGYGTCS